MAKKPKDAPRTLRGRNQSKAAYTLIDLSDLDDELRKDIVLDANEGGGLYGVRVVEESLNGPVRAPIYGVYNDGPDAERWAKAKDELGISGSEVDDAEVYSGAGIEVTDARREAALREAAAQRANAEADAIRAADARDLRAITGDEDGVALRETPPQRIPTEPTVNTVDPGLAEDATNEAANAENQEPEKTTRSSRSSSKNPK